MEGSEISNPNAAVHVVLVFVALHRICIHISVGTVVDGTVMLNGTESPAEGVKNRSFTDPGK